MTPHPSVPYRTVPLWRAFRQWLPTALVVGLGGVAAAQLPLPPSEPPKLVAAAPQAPAHDTKPEKLYTINFDGKEWKSVIQWLADEAGLTLVGEEKPVGTCDIKSNRKYTLGELIDLCNESLAQQKRILIRGEQTIRLWPADKPLPQLYVKPIAIEDLAKRGKSEIVTVTIPLKTILAEDFAKDAKKLKSEFGEITALGANQLVVRDQVVYVQQIVNLVTKTEEDKSDLLPHACKYVRANVLANKLRDGLADEKTDVVTGIGQPTAPGWGGGMGGWGWGQNNNNDPQAGRGGRQQDQRQQPERRFRSVRIGILDESNTVMLTGPADKMNAARELIKTIDVGEKPRPSGGKPMWKTYTVRAGTGEAMAKLIGTADQFKGSSIQVLASGNEIQCWGYPSDHMDLEEFFKVPPPSGGAAMTQEVIALSNTTPAAMVEILGKTITSLYATASGDGVLLRGTPEQIKEAKELIRITDGGASSVPGGARIITIPNGNAGVLADKIAEMMKRMGSNPEVVNPDAPPKRDPAPRPMVPPKGPSNPGESSLQLRTGPNQTLLASAQLVDPNQPKAAPEKKPVVLTVVGNKIYITGTDPQAMELANGLIRLYLQPGTDEQQEQYTVLRLKNVAAEEAARVVTEVFNGPPQQGGGAQQGGRGGRGGGAAGFNPIAMLSQIAGATGASTTPEKGRVRVVAEKTSNSLIVVKASRLDMLTIENLLKEAIDYDGPPEGGVAKTWTIKLQYARASSLAPTIRGLFGVQSTTGGARAGGGGRAAGGNPFAAAMMGGGAQPAPAAATPLTVEYDDTTNKLLVNCTEAMYYEVKKLCDELDKETKNSTEVVEVFSLNGKGVSPTQVQQAVDALFGRTTMTQGMGGRPGMGGGGFPGMGGGGGFPGMGGGGGFPGMGGGGFPGMGGGGGFPGMGGGGMGGRPSGGMGGGGMGGGFPGGGMGGGGMGGGGRPGGGGGMGGGGAPGGGRNNRMQETSSTAGSGGRDFFEYRDMDVPSTLNTLFDPEADEARANPESKPTLTLNSGVVPAQYNQPEADLKPMLAQAQQPVQQPPAQPGPATLTAPNSSTTVVPLESLGAIVIRGRTQEDINVIKAVIEFIAQGQAKTTRVTLTVIPLMNQDATFLVSQLTQIFSRVQVGATATTFPQFGGTGFNFGGGQQGQQALGSVVLFPLPRQNSILLGVPESRLEDIKKQIQQLDVPNGPQMKLIPYQLKKNSARIVAQQIQNFYNWRYQSEPLNVNQTRVTFDITSNTVFVQAAPSDQKDIADLIQFFDSKTSLADNQLKVFRLKNALSDEMAGVLYQTLTAAVVNPQLGSTFVPLPGTATGGAAGAAGGVGGVGGVGGAGGAFGGGAQGGAAGSFGTLTQVNTGLQTKTVGLRFTGKDGSDVESGMFEDVHLVSDPRVNAIVVSAPLKTMRLIEALINELDSPSAAKAYVKVFQLKKADATAAQTLIINLFTSANRTGAGGGGAAAGGVGGTTTTQGIARPLLTLTGTPSDGANLLDLRLTADARTNTLIVAGSQNDLDLVEVIIRKLEDIETPQLVNDVYKLRNQAAADVALAVQTFLGAQRDLLNSAYYQLAANGASTPALQRQFILTPEPISNTILISAPPHLYPLIKQLIERVDMAPPQVFVQVLVAEVQLNNGEDFGLEVGLQSDVLFARGSTAGAAGTPGYNFVTTAAAGSTNLYKQGTVGFQGINQLGVGRTGSNGIGGFVLSATSDTFSFLLRALKTQGRVDVLSRPQLMLTDNQTGFFQVGQQFPRLTGTTLTGTGATQQGVEYVNTGVVLRVTPRISPDGRVLMRVEPSITSPSNSTISLGNGQNATPINSQAIETTVLAGDGETIVLGGLISKSNSKIENKIPFLGDIPWLGMAFRYRTQTQSRQELIFIMTPHIVRSDADMRRIVAEEARKMSWSFTDVQNVHGHGLDVLGQPGAQNTTPPVWSQPLQYQSPLNNLHQYLPGSQPVAQIPQQSTPVLAMPQQFIPPTATTGGAPAPAAPVPNGQVPTGQVPAAPTTGQPAGIPGGMQNPSVPTNVPGTLPAIPQPGVNPAAWNPQGQQTPPQQFQQQPPLSGAPSQTRLNGFSGQIFQPPGTKEGDSWQTYGK